MQEKYDKERLDLEVAREEGKKLDEEEYQKELKFAMAYDLPANARSNYWFLDQEKQTYWLGLYCDCRHLNIDIAICECPMSFAES